MVKNTVFIARLLFDMKYNDRLQTFFIIME